MRFCTNYANYSQHRASSSSASPLQTLSAISFRKSIALMGSSMFHSAPARARTLRRLRGVPAAKDAAAMELVLKVWLRKEEEALSFLVLVRRSSMVCLREVSLWSDAIFSLVLGQERMICREKGGL